MNQGRRHAQRRRRRLAKAWSDPRLPRGLVSHADGRPRLLAGLGVHRRAEAAHGGGVSHAAGHNPRRLHAVCLHCYPLARCSACCRPGLHRSAPYRSRAVDGRPTLRCSRSSASSCRRARASGSGIRPRKCATSSCAMRPEGTEGWDEARLADLVTRRLSMIGTGLARAYPEAAAMNGGRISAACRASARWRRRRTSRSSMRPGGGRAPPSGSRSPMGADRFLDARHLCATPARALPAGGNTFASSYPNEICDEGPGGGS